MTGLLRTSNSVGDAWLFCVVSQLTGGFLNFLMYFIQHCIIYRPSDSTLCRRMQGSSPGLLRLLALAVRRSNYSARSHPRLGYISSTSRLDLIHVCTRSHPHLGQISSTSRLDLIHVWTRSHPHLGQISSTSRLDLIHNSARSHPQLGQISSTSGLDLIHISARSHPRLGQISSTDRLDLIHFSARSHPHLSQISSITRLDLIHISQLGCAVHRGKQLHSHTVSMHTPVKTSHLSSFHQLINTGGYMEQEASFFVLFLFLEHDGDVHLPDPLSYPGALSLHRLSSSHAQSQVHEIFSFRIFAKILFARV